MNWPVKHKTVQTRIIAEWAAMAARSSDFDVAAALVWACRNRLPATEEGDKRLPAWS